MFAFLLELIIITIKVFIKCKILSIEGILSAFTHSGACARTHSHTHAHAPTYARTHARTPPPPHTHTHTGVVLAEKVWGSKEDILQTACNNFKFDCFVP